MDNTIFEVGDTVRYLGCTLEQQRWGNNDFPPCIVDREYIIENVEVHSQHTKVSLKGKCGKFNSVCFSLVKGTVS